MLKKHYADISVLIKKKISDFNYKNNIIESGIIINIGDGVANVYGLNNAIYGEIVEFENKIKGIVLNLEEENVGILLIENFKGIKEGDKVIRTGMIFSINVGEGMLGRVINSLGVPIDGKGPISGEVFLMPLERKAPGVIFREPVIEPLQTGIKCIDSMIPIGRGQRELIIGDRQTGKTTIAIDTIINQKKFNDMGKTVYCIYVSIGQKASTLASIVKLLEKNDALSYTVILTANASDSAAMQVFAPFSGTAIGEFFRDTGRSSLIIYDDLSKQAVAYREISLLLRRPPGREAYPGDIFYLHSRLLERSSKIISDNKVASQMNDIPKSIKTKILGGGSLTSLPIIETQSGDVSSYIPTNVISITDGQIFLETNLFNSGIRPAINEGISVSRVGASAQIKSMKKISGTFKLDQAQFRELESFSQFGSDLDFITKNIIEKGKRNIEILKQSINSPYRLGNQIAIIYAGTNNLLKEIPINKIKNFEKIYLNNLNKNYPEIINLLEKGKLNNKIRSILNNVVLTLINNFPFKN
ncbi:ATP synthase F1, alpha subunit [Candidatus Karelsulcia muelleri CARI]|uniref:ATP synthase subunit alpha n=1 Tax=Karelsulcia muelleri (strain CARI) TaxID=706194 RepID=E0TJ95_KARMC|nr:ATP synthase F1, alpha subunit [Candidatus Karelsulcia muelleri CARI]